METQRSISYLLFTSMSDAQRRTIASFSAVVSRTNLASGVSSVGSEVCASSWNEDKSVNTEFTALSESRLGVPRLRIPPGGPCLAGGRAHNFRFSVCDARHVAALKFPPTLPNGSRPVRNSRKLKPPCCGRRTAQELIHGRPGSSVRLMRRDPRANGAFGCTNRGVASHTLDQLSAGADTVSSVFWIVSWRNTFTERITSRRANQSAI